MSDFTQIFQRVEKKYLLSEYQYFALRRFLERMARVDEYGETSILNIYYDTPDYRLIRTSIDGPAYKEKLRLRTYGTPNDSSNAFVEIKKKYQGIVYKRRIDMPYEQALGYLAQGSEPVKLPGNPDVPHSRAAMRLEKTDVRCGLAGRLQERNVENPQTRMTTAGITSEDSRAGSVVPEPDPMRDQIRREIDWFFKVYPGLAPKMAVSYDRIAMAGITDPDFRVTFDRNIRWRTNDLDLRMGNYGDDLLEPGVYLMELKIRGAVEPELAREFSRLRIFPVSYSKYGRGYLAMLAEQGVSGRRQYAPEPAYLQPAYTQPVYTAAM